MTVTIALDLADEAATGRLGEALAARARPGDVIALEGPLGSGKSTLARAFVRALTAADEEVPSPTFTLVQTYETASGAVWHFDLYRLERPDDAYELDIEDALADGICLIEWPDRLGPLLPARRLHLTLAPGAAETARTATLDSHRQWDDRIGDISV
ncbi:tRNA (adenosine(37)-N6)-threonylcarbamoyltransferase complex ATPase subunit type 1 TsaE [Magnetospirillum sp. UT-4]|uniref:tRNA (adenosine(37)-N6)-threonylcarbamoyltransferase complex ATPase subunit type 1 TsaE n=1 Tax=Magnetospirillum sp. UT-4 TaxID=2681467 RepID=UPI001386558A|nr:tRNA (adenosine(37)-N6)-threonylcarbamoyltransferase complex ATPase subunit type 1 TsaE [Magnetospirillum sp. UT-4]CAA7624296.1 ATPase or kinase [Magnetospirillum sp. UT-4]